MTVPFTDERLNDYVESGSGAECSLAKALKDARLALRDFILDHKMQRDYPSCPCHRCESAKACLPGGK